MDNDGSQPTWRERIWTCPAETRLHTEELSEGLGKPKQWIYRRTQSDADEPLPHRKLDGSLVFRAGEIRAWIRDHEEVMVAGRSDPSKKERRTWPDGTPAPANGGEGSMEIDATCREKEPPARTLQVEEVSASEQS